VLEIPANILQTGNFDYKFFFGCGQGELNDYQKLKEERTG